MPARWAAPELSTAKRVVPFFMLAALLLQGCSSAPWTAAPSPSPRVRSAYSPQPVTRQSGSLTFSDYQQVTDLNVVSATAVPTIEATNAIFANLWTLDPENRFVPDLVYTVPTQENGLVRRLDDQHMDVVIDLKPGLRWSDGQPLTTRDVMFTWQAICDPATHASTTYGFDHISGMTIASDTEMVWHFGPDPTGKRCGLGTPLSSGVFAAYLTLGYFPMSPLPEHVLASVPHSNWATAPYFTQRPTVVSGPYQVASFTPGTSARLVMTPNPDYSAGRVHTSGFNQGPFLDQLTYRVYPDKQSQIDGLKRGEADLALGLVASDLPALQPAAGIQVKSITGLEYEMVLFNVERNYSGCASQGFTKSCAQPTLFADDQGLRQALSLAVDKDAMNRQLVQGIATPLYCPFPSLLQPWFDTSFCDAGTHHRDLAAARGMLDRDGWLPGKDGIRVKKGRRCSFKLSTTAGEPQRASEASLLIANWKEAGCQVTADLQTRGDLFASYTDKGLLATGQFDAALFADQFGPDPDSWATFAESSQIAAAANPLGSNWGRWHDSTLDSLFARGRDQLSVAQRQATYRAVQREWESYAGAVELYEKPQLFAYDSAMGNLFPNANLDSGSWNAGDWYRKP